MSDSNPVQLVKELTFKNSYVPSHTSADFLCVSPNGEHIAIGSSDSLYTFNLRDPDTGWVNKPKNPQSDSVVITDSGSYWTCSRDRVIRHMSSEDECLDEFKHQQGLQAWWGNDEWLLITNGDEFFFHHIDSPIYQTFRHTPIALHAWKHDGHIRLCSISKNKKWIYLHEWRAGQGTSKLISKLRYHHNFFISGISASYPFIQCIHGWPLNDGSTLIKMMPWAIRITADGLITISDDPVAWHPVTMSSSGLPKQRLAELSAYSLQEGLCPDSRFGSMPYLITTLDDDDAVHFISSNWHKRIEKTDIDRINDDNLEGCLSDCDVAMLVLANAEESLPNTDKMVETISDWMTEKNHSKIIRLKTALIRKLFEHSLLPDFDELYTESKKSEFELIDSLFDFLEASKNAPLFAEVFFSVHKRKDEKAKKKERIDRIFQILYPILPKKMQLLIPQELACNDQLLMQVIEQSETPLSTFIISKARKKFFELDRVIKLLEAIKDAPKTLELLCERMLKNRDALTQPSGEWDERIQVRVLDLFSLWDDVFRCEILKQMLRLGIPLINLEDSGNDVQFAKMMQDISTSPREAMTYLVERMYSDPKLFPQSASEILKGISNSRRFPCHLYTMIEIACAQTKEELFSLTEAPKEKLKNNLMYINDLWKQSEGLDDVSRKCFAIVLIEAIKHCLGEQALDTNSSCFSINHQSLMTAEAQLLENKAPQSNPIDEMLSRST